MAFCFPLPPYVRTGFSNGPPDAPDAPSWGHPGRAIPVLSIAKGATGEWPFGGLLMPSSFDRIMDVGTKFLAILIIPTLLWVVKLEVELAVASEQRQVMSGKLTQMDQENKAVLHSIQTNTVTLGKLSTKMDGVKESLDEIKDRLP
jgi:hypothetical protein